MFIECPHCHNELDTYDPLYYDEIMQGFMTCEHCGKKIILSEDDKAMAETEIWDMVDKG